MIVIMMMFVAFMVVVMTASTFAVVMMFMMVFMFFMIVVMAASTFAIVMMFMMMFMFFMIVTASASTFAIMMMMLMFMLFHQFFSQRMGSFDCIQDLLTGQFIPWCCDNHRIRVLLTYQCCSFHLLFLCHALCSAQNDRTGIFYLIVIELTKGSHIHLDLCSIGYCDQTVHFQLCSFCCIFHCFSYIRQFAYSGWLDDNTIRMIFFCYLFQCFTKVTYQRAADTS